MKIIGYLPIWFYNIFQSGWKIGGEIPSSIKDDLRQFETWRQTGWTSERGGSRPVDNRGLRRWTNLVLKLDPIYHGFITTFSINTLWNGIISQILGKNWNYVINLSSTSRWRSSPESPQSQSLILELNSMRNKMTNFMRKVRIFFSPWEVHISKTYIDS